MDCLSSYLNLKSSSLHACSLQCQKVETYSGMMDSPNGRNAGILICSVLSFPELIWLVRLVELTLIYLNTPQSQDFGSAGTSAMLSVSQEAFVLFLSWHI